jgi:hypothetical protein
VAHAAVCANAQAFAGGLEFFLANVVALARLKALGSGSVRGGHGAVALDVGLPLSLWVWACARALPAAGGQGQCGESFFMESFQVVG